MFKVACKALFLLCDISKAELGIWHIVAELRIFIRFIFNSRHQLNIVVTPTCVGHL
jgi:hypothetical protein